MKEGIHPNYQKCVVVCACGNTFETRATTPTLHLDLCSQCHPFYTGKQILIDTTGNVDRFRQRVAKAAAAQSTKKEKKPRKVRAAAK